MIATGRPRGRRRARRPRPGEREVLATLQGRVAPGYEHVRDVFARSLAAGAELGASVAAQVDAEPVVDLWAGWRDGAREHRWERDTLVNVFSTTKGLTATALAVAHARGWFSYDDRVAEHWPEFAAAGKGGVTVRTLLAHQAGLAAVGTPIRSSALEDPARLDALVAAEAPEWEPGEHHGYHGISLGWYAAALLRRVDPQGRSVGRFLAEEVVEPLGLDGELYLGLPDEVGDERLATLVPRRWRNHLPLHVADMGGRFVARSVDPRTLTARAFANPTALGRTDRYDTRRMRRLELPASNAHATARAVAAVYGELAAGGRRLGLDDATRAALAAPAQPPRAGTFDLVLQRHTSFALGWCKPWDGFAIGTRAAFGTPGLGGSVGLADPRRRVGFGYVMNRLGFHPFEDPRAGALRDAVFRCADRLHPDRAP